VLFISDLRFVPERPSVRLIRADYSTCACGSTWTSPRRTTSCELWRCRSFVH